MAEEKRATGHLRNTAVGGRLREAFAYISEHGSYLGMAAPYSLIAWFLMSNEILPHEHIGVRSPYIGMLLVLLLVALAALYDRDAHWHSDNLTILKKKICPVHVFDTAAFIFLLCSVAAFIAVGLWGRGWLLFSFGMIFGGASIGWLYVRWGVFLSRIPIRNAVAFVCTSVGLAVCFKLLFRVLMYAGSLPSGLVAATVVCWGQVCLRKCSQDGGFPDYVKQEKEPGTMPALKSLWKPVLALVMFCGILGYIYNTREGTASPAMLFIIAGYLVEFLSAFLVLWWVTALKKSLNILGIAAVLIIVVATNLVIFACIGLVTGDVSFLITNVDHSLLTLFLWIILIDVSQNYAQKPYLTFAVGWSVRSFPFFMGGVYAKETAASLMPQNCAVLIYFLLFVAVLALADRGISTQSLLGSLVERTQKRAPELEQICDELGTSFGMTPREVEITVLLCRGRSRPFIAEQLGVSENTVRNHTKSIYSKLGIHNRQSLLNIVEASQTDPDS